MYVRSLVESNWIMLLFGSIIYCIDQINYCQTYQIFPEYIKILKDVIKKNDTYIHDDNHYNDFESLKKFII